MTSDVKPPPHVIAYRAVIVTITVACLITLVLLMTDLG